MHLPKFEHIRPETIKEATQLLNECGPRGRLVAGGTDLFPRMKYGLDHPEVIISLKGIPVKAPELKENGGLHLDALTSLADLVRSPLVLEYAPILVRAVLCIGSNEIRHMATLGGNVCLENRCFYYNQSHTFQFVEPCFKRNGHLCYQVPGGRKCLAVFSADTVPALIALDAFINITGPESSRNLPLEKLYTGDALNPLHLSGNEVVTEIIIPGHRPPNWGTFVKFAIRGGMEFGALNLAVNLEMDQEGASCQACHMVVGSVSAAPLRMLKAEKILVGQSLSNELFEEAALTVSSEAHPYPHHGYSAEYLRECLRVQTRRALSAAFGLVQMNRKGSKRLGEKA
jgi:CO/xanthine dehydrogenase FAD-binding subunit